MKVAALGISIRGTTRLLSNRRQPFPYPDYGRGARRPGAIPPNDHN
jgi:hypothetical protein